MLLTQKAKEQRARVLAYKRTFHGDDGKTVLFDLMNKFHILNPHSGDGFAEGQRTVVLHILKQLNISMEQFDKLLSGELGE